MEKLNLKWNDFQTTVSQSFSSLRREEELFDVTLVSDDEIQVLAHKLVLSASSSFFKSIFKKITHPQPLLYLKGVDSTNIEHVLDYIYQGEVEILQEQLPSFLHIAQTLKIAGLVFNDNEEILDGIKAKKQEILHAVDNGKSRNNPIEDFDFESDNESIGKDVEKESCPLGSKASFASDSLLKVEVKSKVKEILTESNGEFTCTACGKTGKDKRNMRRHVETHLDGLSFKCNVCEKSFRTRDSRRKHNHDDQ